MIHLEERLARRAMRAHQRTTVALAAAERRIPIDPYQSDALARLARALGGPAASIHLHTLTTTTEEMS